MKQKLTTLELHELDRACVPITNAFKNPPYLVGSAEKGDTPGRRDVDVRLMLDEEEFKEVCPTLDRWELWCLVIGFYLRAKTGLPIDFQIQLVEIANRRYPKERRNPLGLDSGRLYAGGGDATPFLGRWDD